MKRKPLHGGYYVKDRRGMEVYRPSKLARGMTKTYARSRGEKLSEMACRLLVRGTLDTSGGWLMGNWNFERKPCPCCGTKNGKLMLNDRGRQTLARLRLRK